MWVSEGFLRFIACLVLGFLYFVLLLTESRKVPGIEILVFETFILWILEVDYVLEFRSVCFLFLFIFVFQFSISSDELGRAFFPYFSCTEMQTNMTN